MMFGVLPRSSGPLALKLDQAKRTLVSERQARAKRNERRREKVDRLVAKLTASVPEPSPQSVTVAHVDHDPGLNEPGTVNQIVLAREIIEQVAGEYGLTYKDLRADTRRASVVRARHKAIFLIVQATDFSYPRIGRMMGGKDHTTVLHAACQHAARNGLVPPRGLATSASYQTLVQRFDQRRAEQGRAG